jgi:hypothetical protein
MEINLVCAMDFFWWLMFPHFLVSTEFMEFVFVDTVSLCSDCKDSRSICLRGCLSQQNPNVFKMFVFNILLMMHFAFIVVGGSGVVHQQF